MEDSGILINDAIHLLSVLSLPIQYARQIKRIKPSGFYVVGYEGHISLMSKITEFKILHNKFTGQNLFILELWSRQAAGLSEATLYFICMSSWWVLLFPFSFFLTGLQIYVLLLLCAMMIILIFMRCPTVQTWLMTLSGDELLRVLFGVWQLKVNSINYSPACVQS